MKFLNLIKLNRAAKVVWSIYLCCGVLILAWVLRQSFDLPPASFGLWFAFAALTFLAGWFPVKIPHTTAHFCIGKFFILLCVILIGVPEAVLLAGLEAFALNSRLKNEIYIRFSETAQAIIATAIAGEVFYLVLFSFGIITERPLGMQSVPFEHLALTTTIFAVLFFGVDAILGSILHFFNKRQAFLESWREQYFWLLLNYFFAVVAACPMQILLAKFGWLGGIWALPIIGAVYFLAGSFFYRMSHKSEETIENEKLHLATIQTLASAIDARDQMSHGHIRRVKFYARRMAQMLNLSASEVRTLETAALLHGVGKLAVPDQILNKPQALNQAETEKVKTHTTIGAAILEQVNFPYPVTQTILHYRERWDGNGYPEGLRGEEIPLPSRILSIIDAYDTLRENRPYRLAKSRDEARKLLHAGAGAEFDPKLIDIFLRNLTRFEAEMDAQGIVLDEDTKKNLSFKLSDVHLGESNGNSQTSLEQIKQANREMFSLYELAREFSSSLDLRNTLKLFGDKVQELVSCDTCAVYLYDEQKGYATPAFINGRNSAFLSERIVRIGEGVTGLVLKTGEAIGSVSPLEDFTEVHYDIAVEYTAMAAVPLVSGSRVIGALAVYSTKFVSYRDEDMRVLEAISRIATDALSRAIDHAESETRALTDPMTGLPNARCLQMQFEKEAARAQRTQSGFQVIMLDLDEFKKVNDTFGHKVGDFMLREISIVMRSQLREYDFLARYAGDEFVAILPDINEERAQELCQRMEKAVLNFRLPVGENFARVGISIGLAAYPTLGETLDQVLIAADRMMYSVKAAHKQKRPSAAPPPLAVIPTAVIKPAEIIMPEIDDNIVLEIDEDYTFSNALN